MSAAHIETTITVEHEGVFLFECECIAEIDYELDGGTLYDFSIEDLRFEKTEGRWTGEVFWVTTAETHCPPDLREILLRCADYAAIEERLIERLTASGDIKPASAQLRAEHNSAVL